jgi:hypothetical protein
MQGKGAAQPFYPLLPRAEYVAAKIWGLVSGCTGRFGSKTSRRTSKPPRMAALLFDALEPWLACCAENGVL